jgi:hypothetical protein
MARNFANLMRANSRNFFRAADSLAPRGTSGERARENHAMNHGNRRELIFLDDEDRQRFVATLGEVCAKTDLPREIGDSTPH